MDWISLKNIVRRTKTPVIVTDETGEPLIILPLSMYQGSAVQVQEVRPEATAQPLIEPPKPPKSEHRSLLEEISGEAPAELPLPAVTKPESKSQPVIQREAPPQVESVMAKLPPQPVQEGVQTQEERFIFMQ